ncbi:MAG: ECF transporter S component [Nitrososphaerota archaeon]|nr:ECF transporter S component [Candidatus Bathyarchaeota archaeon]MDW8023124.1 ECF transporter S component [Nitrososphaerota archaeon]
MRAKTSPVNLAITTIFTALVCAATMMFSIYVPATKGFFNIGESMVFTSALLFGPFVGAFAGGVGSMLADILLGFPHYAPATIIVKALEGAVVGILKKRNPKFSSKLQWRFLTMILGFVAGVLLGSVGAFYYSGEVELTLGLGVFHLYIPVEFWMFLGAITALSILVAGFVFDPELGWTIFSVVAGGFCMVLGYFLYQWLLIYPLFKIEVVAAAEIPINIGQMIIGAMVALPIVKVVWRAFPHLKEK